jgi:hypothetical protein
MPTNYAKKWTDGGCGSLRLNGRADDRAERAVSSFITTASGLVLVLVLARPVEGVANASKPYDMAIIVPEAVSPGVEEPSDDPWLHEFSDAVHFEIKPIRGSPSFEAEVFWGQESYGKIGYDFSIGANSSPLVKPKVLNWRTDADHQDSINAAPGRSRCQQS